MKKRIPKESWKDVITIYGGEGAKLTEWTGTENSNNARVILLDEEGRVRRGWHLAACDRVLANALGSPTEPEAGLVHVTRYEASSRTNPSPTPHRPTSTPPVVDPPPRE